MQDTRRPTLVFKRYLQKEDKIAFQKIDAFAFQKMLQDNYPDKKMTKDLLKIFKDAFYIVGHGIQMNGFKSAAGFRCKAC